ncbi:MAG: class F sortase [Pseudonocardiaceae bacterium]|nr:class F sortase [Pseudonocardiaceae bacterium]
MTGPSYGGGRREPGRFTAAAGLTAAAAVVLSLLAALVIVAGFGVGAAGRTGVSAPIAQAPAGAGTEGQAAHPVHLRIPTIDVAAPVDPLRVDENGVLPPPDTYEGTGWWLDGPEPGEIGPAVIAGHVDSFRGPAVFYHLDDLERGDRIFVDRADETTAVFAVDRTERHSKDEFPTDEVYGDTPNPQLRLITCGGAFNRTERSYVDNVITFATLVDVTRLR